MFEVVTRLFGRDRWDPEESLPLWGGRRSLFAHVKAHIVAGRNGLTQGGENLPDETEVFKAGGLRWVAGAMDGVLGHHGSENQEGAAEKVYADLVAFLRQPTKTRAAKFYATLQEQDCLTIVDRLLEQAVNARNLDVERLHSVAIWLATKAPDREAVKAGIALLGIVQGHDDREIVLTLARHEEFTLYAVVAIANTEREPESTLWEVARQVKGWGRIHAVERLAKTTNPAIRSWLLREGYKNSIMYEYLAHTCATAGDLKGALAGEAIDEPLLLAAGDIIKTLIEGRGGPAEDIDAYEDGAAVTLAYLQHLDGRANRLEQFLILKTIEGFLSEDDGWTERLSCGWSEDVRHTAKRLAARLAADSKWLELAERDLQEKDLVRFSIAAQAAERLGIDTWPVYFSRTRSGEDHWFHLMRADDKGRIVKVASLAETVLPLSAMATGPGDELGLGSEFKHHSALGFVVQGLARYPGLGWSLVKTALNSPVVRNRNMAIRALDAWGRENWPDETSQALEACRSKEPVVDVRLRLERLLAEHPVE